MKELDETEETPKICDPATKPASTPIPNGMSNQSYVHCNATTGEWEWIDPQIAE